MNRVLAIVAVILAGLALIVALNRGPEAPAPVGTVPTFSFEAPLPDNKYACENAGGVWIPDDPTHPEYAFGGDCVS